MSGPLGYLSEGSRTNLFLFNNSLSNAAWTKTNLTTGTSLVCPDGVATPDGLMVETATTSTHYARQVITVAAAPFTFTVYAKAGTRTRILLREDTVSGNSCSFNLTTGQVLTAVGSTGTCTPIGNGWYKCSMTYTATAGALIHGIYLLQDTGTIYADAVYLGDVSKSLSVWCINGEQASFASSPIFTAATAVTRAADSLTYPSAGNVSGTVGTVYAEFNLFANANATQSGIVSSDAGSGPLLIWASNDLRLFDSTNFAAGAGVPAPNVTHKGASYWAGSASGILKDGGSMAAVPFDGSMPFAQVAIGMQGVGSQTTSLTVRNVRIYPTALTSAQLVALTAP